MGNLSTKQKATLRRSSPTAVASALGQTRKHLGKGFWLAKSNKYRTLTVRRLEKDFKSGTVREGELKQYIAASALPHCTDGWSFLGRALNAHQMGQPGAALHFAYYAELRAAMSFLATRGIGIFDRRHWIVVQPKRARAGRAKTPSCVCLTAGGTHLITWQALEYWGRILAFGPSDLLLRVIAPAGIQLSDWLANFANPVSGWLGKKWLRNWGLDLEQFAEDREARNQVSYRPGDLNEQTYLEASAASSFLIEFWSLFEPSGSRFDLLDRHILRSSLEDVFFARTAQIALGNAQYEQHVQHMLVALRPPGPQEEWLSFLTRGASAATPRVLTLAEKKSRFDDPEHHLQVISRAALLLRLATGACELLKREVALAREDLSFWWGSLGERRGLWSAGNEPPNCVDLWGDISIAVEDERTWLDANGASNPSYMKWRNDRAQGLGILGECERIGLWGLGL